MFEQIGNTADVYNYPKTGYVARFVGGANVFFGRVVSCAEASGAGSGAKGGTAAKNLVQFEHPAGRAALEFARDDDGGGRTILPGTEIHAAVREEHVLLEKAANGGNGLAAVVTGINFAGGLLRITVLLKNGGGASDDLAEDTVCASRSGIDAPLETGDEVLVSWLPGCAVLVDS